MVSIYSLVAISFERRRAIVLSQEQHTVKVLRIIIPVIWAWSFCVCVPTIFEYSEFRDISVNQTGVLVHCGSTRSVTYSVVNGLMLVFVAYIIPLVLIISNCVVVVRFIWKIGKEAEMTNQRRIVAAKKIKIIHLLVVATALFAVSWAPYFALLVIAKVVGLDDVNQSGQPVNLIRIALSAFSAVYNVFLYVIYNSQFREEFKAILSYVKCSRNITPSRVAPLFQIQQGSAAV
ncbi:substance-P receptor-like [Gigantopelta aegis]|uniref:substance-P receptor-like n=1 Tax=Gigantopelta aegis TaxID=1735272 RepID=UPI001B88C441|nr:substance-P receptor-like [Gigantopelta aegis]